MAWRGWLLLMAVFMSECFVYAWCRVQCVQVGYEITHSLDRQRQLMVLQNNLKVELERLKSPERIGGIAARQIGLTQPRPDQMVVIP
jgi:hypothetical protein